MRNQRAAVTGLAIAAVAFAGACSDIAPTEPRAADSDVQLFGAPANPSADAESGMDAILARVAQVVPGYGGHFYDEDLTLNVYLTPPAKVGSASAVRQALASELAALGIDVSASPVRVLAGQYDFAQLHAMHRQARSVLGLAGVVYTDAQERTNRIEIGVENAPAADAVRRALAMTSVPSEAVEIREVAPIHFTQSLRDRVRPVAGGLQINFPGFLCTLGFNVRSPEHPNRQGFVTNSHCTNEQWQMGNTPYWQPSSGVPDSFIGTEAHDAPGFTGGVCPPGRLCRNSDAAGVEYAPGVPNAFARIYRTTGVNSLTIDANNPFFNIVAEAPTNLAVGDSVHKVGRTTGWTRGTVTNSCVDTNVSGTNFTVFCQDWVSAATQIIAGGDSGSGAWTPAPLGQLQNVRLNGILWGGNIPTGTIFVFSPMQRVRLDNPPPYPGVSWRTFPPPAAP